MSRFGDFLWGGLREAALMLWMTFWPLVLGFTISGVIQSFVKRDGLRRTLGTSSFRSASTASVLGVISSSCSYAASAMARALFVRGASFTNATIFMIASTNLVIELGIVLYLLLGWQFLVAQIIGGLIMVAILALVGRRLLDVDQEALRAASGESPEGAKGTEAVPSFREAQGWFRAARYTIGDITMLRKELFFGFLVAGFLAAEVPDSWWSHLFMTNHGWWTILENVAIAPLFAVISFVCSVGNIPLAAALWVKGASFGGVISFIFADLVTLPLLLIYRRFYGGARALRLFLVLWAIMSTGGLLIELMFRALHVVPPIPSHVIMGHEFSLGWNLWLNIVAAVILLIMFLLGRRSVGDEGVAIDPVCGMQVAKDSPAAVAVVDGVHYYFCAPRCQDRFVKEPATFLGQTPVMMEDPNGDATDPICGMKVNSKQPPAQADSPTGPVYFCSEGCRGQWLAGPNAAPGTQQISLSRKNKL
jgi:hypothetical protein